MLNESESLNVYMFGFTWIGKIMICSNWYLSEGYLHLFKTDSFDKQISTEALETCKAEKLKSLCKKKKGKKK